MKWTDFFNIALFAFLWVMLIEKKSGLKKWILDVTNEQLMIGIIVPIVFYAAIVIAGRIMKNKYLNAE
ncbi:MAG: hypothetical protein ACQET8_08390 [Bacillota bacterium]|uniref:Uncharacterized protein n=1 Tax=Fictibacillus nanhaiensis TaxID=742169 RepID=A0ABS2ZW01_9BACL|nr:MULTISPECIES: hypothetical protein [Fictibacillus]MBH0170927.1 hypothetical protein [Fictibacillus sp. 18YEL24]MBN3556488.1 hypothetical protein [Fictibacillus nanhaiensis]